MITTKTKLKRIAQLMFLYNSRIVNGFIDISDRNNVTFQLIYFVDAPRIRYKTRCRQSHCRPDKAVYNYGEIKSSKINLI